MKKYEAPELKVIALDAVDIIQTSGVGGENELPPYKPTSLEMDSEY